MEQTKKEIEGIEPPALDIFIANPRYKLSIKSLSILLLKGFNLSRCGRVYNVSPQAVSQYIYRHYDELAPLLDCSGQLLSQELKHLSLRIVRSVSERDIKKAGLRDRMIAAGVALDKSQVLKGLPSAINAVISISSEELSALRKQSAEDARRAALEVIGEVILTPTDMPADGEIEP